MAILDYNTDIRASWEEGMEKGREEGRALTLVSNIRNLMKNVGLSLTEAMNALSIPLEEQKRLASLI